jgi:imidazolonepropionase-like amidohydrolase
MIACGSDVGVFAHGENARELELMVASGMSPLEALRSATTTAAKVLRKEKDLGRVAKGYIADLIAVRGDPLVDLTVIRKPVVVLKAGKIELDRRSAP